jgi:VIT1/CCC1 family predicted Fe2+/Mn2+ transporter
MSLFSSCMILLNRFLTGGLIMHLERHSIERVGWLRAAVLGANDGIVSTASLVLGVASANTSSSGILLAGVAGLVAGAMSMATGEYVSVSSQVDTENAALAQEKGELENDFQGETQELTSLYIKRGLNPTLAREVAEQLMEKDALGAHAREELGLTETNSAQPLQAALFSAVSFSAGAILPLIVAWLAPHAYISTFIILTTLFSLAILGYISSVVGNASPVKAIIRITFWSAMAMGLSIGVGHFAGQNLI